MVKTEFEQEIKWFVDYYGYDMNKTMTTTWFELSKKYTREQFSRALRDHIRMDEYGQFPAFGKIFKHLGSERNLNPMFTPLIRGN